MRGDARRPGRSAGSGQGVVEPIRGGLPAASESRDGRRTRADQHHRPVRGARGRHARPGAAAPQAAVTSPTIAPEVVKNPEVQPEIDTITSIKNAIAAGANTENRSINFNDILFKYDSDSISTESNASLNEAYSFLNEIPQLKVKIVGHTSNEGKAKYNQKLSKKRAVAVLNYLIGKGITEDRMVAEGKGSGEPIAENDTNENKQKNRRIQFIITDDGNK